MARYIDADKLKAVIENTYLDGDSPFSHLVINDEDTLIGKFQTIDIIDDQPTADVQEVRYGKWIVEKALNGKMICWCSHCGLGLKNSETDTYVDLSKAKFCPNCGAMM